MGSTCVEARWFRRENLWGVWSLIQRDNDRVLWEHRGRGQGGESPGVRDLLRVTQWLCSRCRTGTPGALICNMGDSQLPPHISGGNAHIAHCSVPHGISSRHTCAAIAVLVHEIQFVYTQQMWTVQGPAMCFIHLVNRHFLSTATVCQALFW